jgi:hypothetical protein
MSLAYRVADDPVSTTPLWVHGGLDQLRQLARAVGASRYPRVTPAPDEFSDYEHYALPRWDGYGAEPITSETVQAARSFRLLLPMDAPQPDIAPGGDGTIGFEWRSGSPENRTLILVDVGPGDLITARRVDDAGRIERLQPTQLGTGARALVAQLFS